MHGDNGVQFIKKNKIVLQIYMTFQDDLRSTQMKN